MNKTKIDWCTHTLNPVIGCTHCCEYCYAKKLNNRFGWIEDFSKPKYFPDRLKMLDSKQPKVIFMDSMSDIADWENDWVGEVVCAIANNPQHKYLFLTKRLTEALDNTSWWKSVDVLPIYIGVSVINQAQMNKCSESIYKPDFLSIEPIHEEINISTNNPFLRWIIIGGETGNRKNKVIPKREWIESIVNQCRRANMPVFMKSSLKGIWGEELIQEYPW
jgi:protein gp37